MVLISIDPFASRRIVLIIAALLGFSALCFADPVLMVQRYGAVSQTTPTGSTELGAGTEIQRVDMPSRTQAFLPSEEQGDQSLSVQPDLFFSTVTASPSISV